VRLLNGAHTVALTAGPDGVFTGALAISEPVPYARVDVVDDRGTLIGTTEIGKPPVAAPPPDAAPVIKEKVRYPILGAYAPLWQVSPSTDVLWFAPTPPDGAVTSVGLVHAQGEWSFQGQVRAGGSIGPIGLEAALRSNTSDDKTADASGWLGVRGRVLRLDGSLLEVAPSLRVGFPAASMGMPAQIEPGVAVGGAAARFTWLVDAGARIRLESDTNMTGVPTGQAFLLAGGTFDPISWLRLNALLDAHLVIRDGGTKNGLGGLGVGIEGGGAVYGGLSLHVSPWNDRGFGPFMAQLAVGFRATP